MIAELDGALQKLLKERVPLDSKEVDISFDMPAKEWSVGLSRPTVNLYLFDIRENLDLRESDWLVERSNGDAVKRLTPRRIDLSYLITAWTTEVEDEHRLLWYVMASMFRYPQIPDEYLEGPLARQVVPLRLQVAQPDGVLKNPADFWSALENRLKPGVTLTVTVPLDLGVEIKVPLVLTKRARVASTTEPPRKPVEAATAGKASPAAQIPPDEVIQIAGRVRVKGSPIEGAQVLLKERGLTIATDTAGQFIFPRIGTGRYTLVVTVPGKAPKQRVITVPQREYDIDL